MPVGTVRRAVIDSVWHFATDGEGMSPTDIARDLRLDVEVVARVLSFEACGSCKRRAYPLSRVKGRGKRLCGGCAARVRRGRTVRPGGRVDEVPVAPIRDAFLRSGLSASEVARRVGWMRTRRTRRSPVADATRVRRTLGLAQYDPGHGHEKRFREFCDPEMAWALAKACGADPMDVGL
jgi:hypothetical protein